MSVFLILCLAIITFSSRYLFIEPKLPLKLSARASTLLSFSAPAVLTAIWAPIIFIRDNTLAISVDNPYLIAGSIAIFVSYKTHNIYLTMFISGFIFVWLKL